MNENKQSSVVEMDVSFRSVPPQGNLLGFADVTFCRAFTIRGFRLMSGTNGLFVGMPGIKEKDSDTYRDVFYPITAESREALTKAISDAYANDIQRMRQT